MIRCVSGSRSFAVSIKADAARAAGGASLCGFSSARERGTRVLSCFAIQMCGFARIPRNGLPPLDIPTTTRYNGRS